MFSLKNNLLKIAACRSASCGMTITVLFGIPAVET